MNTTITRALLLSLPLIAIAKGGLADQPSTPVMTGIPPTAESQVTKKNWLVYPYLTWSFKNTSAPLNTLMIPRAGQIRELPRSDTGLNFKDQETGKSLPDLFEDNRADGIIVIKGETILEEAYFNNNSEHRQHIWFSMTKSLVSSAFGTLVDQGLIDLSKSPAEYIPELRDSAFARTTVQNVLDHTSAIGFTENYTDPTSDFQRFYAPALGMLYSKGAADADPMNTEIYGAYDFLATVKPNAALKPGEAFEYNSSNTDVLGWLLAKLLNKSLDQILHEQIWSQIGAEHDAFIAVDRAYMPAAAGGFNSTLRDAARFGLMIRDFGRVGDRQVVSKAWIDHILNVDSKLEDLMSQNPIYNDAPWQSYHDQWWILDRDRGEFCAIGIHGQVIYINRATDTVMVWFSSQEDASSMKSPNFMPKLNAARRLAVELN